MGTQSGSSKVCIICGQDVAGRPRIKDRAGNYYCKFCADAQLAAQGAQSGSQAKAPPVPPVAPVSAAAGRAEQIDSDLVGAAAPADTSVRCPGCGAGLNPQAVLCVNCGFNRQTGQKLATQTPKPIRERRSVHVNITPGTLAVGLLALYAILYAAALFNPALYLLYAGIAMLGSLASLICLIVWAFQDGHTVWAILGIISPFVPCVPLINLYYVFAVTERGHLTALYLVHIIATIGMIVLAYQVGMSADEMRELFG